MTNKQSYFSGWDIGGAHVKVARCDNNGNIIEALQVACPLWQGIESLESAIQEIQKKLGNHNDLAAITMTGELVDIFENRQAGVSQILQCLESYISIDKISIYARDNVWLNSTDARVNWQLVASMNWQASAVFTSGLVTEGIFIDIGSTTSDIIPIKQGKVCTQGIDDHQRQLSRELLYTGAIRTPLIALVNEAPFDGQLVSLAAEVFATTGDCWCLLGMLEASSIQDNSSDGMSWQKEYCARRIARLIGKDTVEPLSNQWIQLAQWFTEQQVHQINNACLQVISNQIDISINAPIIGAGIGRFIAQMCAERLNRPFIDFSTLVSPNLSTAADHTPAVAVALLAQQQFT